MRIKMNSPNSMRSSLKRDGTMNLSWRHPCRTPPSLRMAGLVHLSMGILGPRHPWAILRALRNLSLKDISALGLKVCDPQRILSSNITLMSREETQSHQPNTSPYYGADQAPMYPPTSQSPDPRNRTPPAGASYQPVHHRPESTYEHPQELGTSVYDSPVEHPSASQRLPYPASGQAPPAAQPPFQQQQQQQQQEYPPYAPEDAAKPQPPYPIGPASNQQPPMHQPPPVPGTTSTPTPYPSLTPGAAGYQAYNPSQGTAPNSNPASFYR